MQGDAHGDACPAWGSRLTQLLIVRPVLPLLEKKFVDNAASALLQLER